MSDTIKVLKEIIKGEGFDYNITKEYVIALKEALLALEKLDRLEKWLKDEIEKRDLDAEHCFNENDVLTESLIQRQIDVLKEVREVLKNE